MYVCIYAYMYEKNRQSMLEKGIEGAETNLCHAITGLDGRTWNTAARYLPGFCLEPKVLTAIFLRQASLTCLAPVCANMQVPPNRMLSVRLFLCIQQGWPFFIGR